MVHEKTGAGDLMQQFSVTNNSEGGRPVGKLNSGVVITYKDDLEVVHERERLSLFSPFRY